MIKKLKLFVKLRKRLKQKKENNIQEIEDAEIEDVDELFANANTVKDVEYIEVCFRNGEVKKFEHDELEWYGRVDSTIEIKTKTRRVIIHLNEVRIITIKNFPSKSVEKERRPDNLPEDVCHQCGGTRSFVVRAIDQEGFDSGENKSVYREYSCKSCNVIWNGLENYSNESVKKETENTNGHRVSIPKEDEDLKPFTEYSDITP